MLTPLEKKLKEMRKRGARAADERTKLLGATAAPSTSSCRRGRLPHPPLPLLRQLLRLLPAPTPVPAPAPAPARAPASVPFGARPLTHQQKLLKRKAIDAWSNDACTCKQAEGHSMFCQIYKCYAYEIGCCDPEFSRARTASTP